MKSFAGRMWPAGRRLSIAGYYSDHCGHCGHCGHRRHCGSFVVMDISSTVSHGGARSNINSRLWLASVRVQSSYWPSDI